jgi:uncharacterized glyoxalase superfamily protein PhnB
MNDTPPGWPRISSALYYDDAAAAIDWLCSAFRFEVRLKVEGEGGRIEHSELTFGEGLIMVASTDKATPAKGKSPRSLDGANTQGLFVYVDDLDAHLSRARAGGAKILTEPETHDYGDEHWVDRLYQAEDLEGHRFWFGQRMRTGSGGQ